MDNNAALLESLKLNKIDVRRLTIIKLEIQIMRKQLKILYLVHGCKCWIFATSFSFSLEEFIYNYLITLSNYIIPKKGVWING